MHFEEYGVKCQEVCLSRMDSSDISRLPEGRGEGWFRQKESADGELRNQWRPGIRAVEDRKDGDEGTHHHKRLTMRIVMMMTMTMMKILIEDVLALCPVLLDVHSEQLPRLSSMNMILSECKGTPFQSFSTADTPENSNLLLFSQQAFILCLICVCHQDGFWGDE